MTMKTDVVIVGGGLAGSLAAAMLGRAGIDCVLVDPHEIYPQEFRCEKLDGPQVALLQKTGLVRPVLRAATPDGMNRVARFGRVVEKREGDQHGIFYAPLVNTVRGEIPRHVPFVRAKAQAIAAGEDRQTVTLAGGGSIDARLVLLSNGLSVSLRDQLDLRRDVVSPCHSITIGFNAVPRGRKAFQFPALTYYAERPADGAALITLFPIGEAMRANLFVYRGMSDPWLHEIRRDTQAALYQMMPGLRALLGDFEVDGRVEIRPIDLYETHGHRRPGVVLAGDAFATSCPAAGTGARKVLNDVERLCNVHIPQWLATRGMGEGKIGSYYDDPVKRACDAFAADKARALKDFSLGTTPGAHVRRWIKFAGQATRGHLRPLRPFVPLHAQHGALRETG
jgi:2-polyprenyl-6-methoxyphenol hydroxylase-like FAD-dependent oxidoreductase